MKRPKIAIWSAVISAILFGASTPASKWILDSMQPFTLAGLLYLGAAVGVLPLIIKEKVYRSPQLYPAKTKKLLLGAILFGGIIGPALLLFGLATASSSSVSLWLNLELVTTALLGAILFREHISINSILAVLGTVLASMLLTVHEGSAGIIAGLLVLGACVAWGFDNHFTSLIDGISPALTTFWKGLIAGTVNLIIGIIIEQPALGAGIIAYALLIGVFAYGVSIVLYIGSSQHLGATRAQIIFGSAPFWGLLLSTVVLGEPISILQLVAAGLMVLSIAILIREDHHHGHTHMELEHEHWHSHSDGHHDHHGEESIPAWHSHPHHHHPVTHVHMHLPDLHHRHDHSSE
ncbi:MAG: DMT family transporter [Candidatus Marinimicrobia bacterium]|nr:DMT family transporter [Candidatus Neomarinimicrobiota bacterium]